MFNGLCFVWNLHIPSTSLSFRWNIPVLSLGVTIYIEKILQISTLKSIYFSITYKSLWIHRLILVKKPLNSENLYESKLRLYLYLLTSRGSCTWKWTAGNMITLLPRTRSTFFTTSKPIFTNATFCLLDINWNSCNKFQKSI